MTETSAEAPFGSRDKSLDPAQQYGAAYFASHCGTPYERNDHWTQFFAVVADHIVRDIAPATVLDVGCAMGFLVESLVDRGVDAVGIDISDYAIGQARPDIRDRLTAGSALVPFGRRFDLITCVEVIEHLTPAEADQLVVNICAHTDDVVLSSTPLDYREETHVNVNPPEVWAEMFARQGLFRDVDYDLFYLAPWATRFRRARDPLPRVIRDYERVLWHLQHAAHDRNEVVLEQARRIEALTAAGSAERNDRLQQELSRLSDELGAQQRLFVQSVQELRAHEEELASWHSSGAARLAKSLQRGVAVVAPPASLRRQTVHELMRAAAALRDGGPTALRTSLKRRRDRGTLESAEVRRQYEQWRALNEPDWAALKHMRVVNQTWPWRPLVSIVMPTYNPDATWLQEAIDSVQRQAYENWELCIADDGSTRAGVRTLLELVARVDPRIKVTFRARNEGIAAASNSALEMTTGEFVALLDHDDVLRPHALHRMVEYLQDARDADVIYSDEDVLAGDGSRPSVFFKPDWSPSFLLSVNYVCHLLFMRRSLVQQVGGFRAGFDGSQDHDLVLRITEVARHVGHVAEVLYSWRQHSGSVALDPEAKMYAYEAGSRAVEEALQRRGTPGRVQPSHELGRYHSRLLIAHPSPVAIIIPTRDRVALLRDCIDSIERQSSYRAWTITIIDNDSADPETLDYFEKTPHRVIRHPGYFNYSRLINAGRSHIEAPYMLTLNNDVTVITPDWLEALVEQAQQSTVGVVGGRLLFPDGRPQHEGIGLGNVGGGHIACNLDAGWMGRVIRDVGAVTGACQMIKTSVFDQVGGYDETIHVAFNDVDFCLRVRAAGHRIVYTPHAELRHRESATRGRLNPSADAEIVWDRWGPQGGLRDPYVSPHLRLLHPLTLNLGPLPSDR